MTLIQVSKVQNNVVSVSLIIFTEGPDYDSGPYTVTFNAGDTRAAFNILINNDNVLEGNETFNLTINQFSLPSEVDVSSSGQAVATIVDDDGNQ